jgi:pyruvate formate lyase activating enzyme
MGKVTIDIKGFLETSFVDWPGKVCSVIFLPGCNFRCPYCHNHELIFNSQNLKSFSLKEIIKKLRGFEGWIDGVCISGGEPTVHSSLPWLVKEIKRGGFLVKLDTNGTHPVLLKNLIDAKELDYVAMDVKAPLDDNHYSRCAGCPVDLEKIKKSIKILKDAPIPVEFRTTVVPKLLSEEDIYQLTRQLKGVKTFTLQNFNPINPLDPSFKDLSPYEESKLQEMKKKVSEIIVN